MRRSLRPRRGVAIVELLLAASILAVCVVPIVAGVSYLRTNAAEAQVQSEILSKMKTILVSELDKGKITKLVQSVTPVTSSQSLPGGTTVTYTLTTTAVTGYKNLFSLACAASWRSPSTANRADSATLTMYALSI